MIDTAGDKAAPLLSVRGLTKFFGSFAACDRIDFDVRAGEIHALLGENGAGKSTLVKMLFGVLSPSAGRIVWRGAPVEIASPAQARRAGIGMVFQHFSLFETLTVAENIALGLNGGGGFPIGERRRGGCSLRAVADAVRVLSAQYGLPLDPAARVGDLSGGERQRIEIVRALLQDPRLIILDEPTSVLTPHEAERLFETLARLKAQGRSVLYISHRLEEVRRICDRATVLRHGRVTASCDPRRETPASLARMMVGSDVPDVTRPVAASGAPLVEVEGLSAPARTPFAVSLKSIAMRVRAGEILAIAGVAGNGQSELFDALSGEYRLARDETIRLRGTAAGRLDINERRLLGAAFVPEERRGHASVEDMPLSANVLLSRHGSDRKAFLSGGVVNLIRREAIKTAAARICRAMDVRKSGDDPAAGSLSGGNLQKFIVGRELDRRPAILVVNQPTWGVDAGAARRIRQALVDLARDGSAVIVISQDIDEIFEVATSIAVLSGGRLSQAHSAETMTAQRIGLMMGGIFTAQTEAAPHAHRA